MPKLLALLALLALLTVLAALATKRGRAREQQLLTHLAAHPYSRGPEICQALGWSRVSLHSMIERLIDEGRVTPYWNDGPNTRRAYCVAITPAIAPDIKADNQQLRRWLDRTIKHRNQAEAEHDSLGRETDRLRTDWTAMRARAEQAEATLRAARFTEQHWRWHFLPSNPAAAHALAMVRAALDGQTDPSELGLPEEEHAAFLAALDAPPTAVNECSNQPTAGQRITADAAAAVHAAGYPDGTIITTDVIRETTTLRQQLQDLQDEMTKRDELRDAADRLAKKRTTERDKALKAFNATRTKLADTEAERDGAYRERAHLLAWLAALHPTTAVIAPALDINSDGETDEGWQLLYLVAGGRQMTWHIAPQDTPLFEHVEHVDFADPRAAWDRHTTDQKYARMRSHTRLLANSPTTDDELGHATDA